MNDILWGWRTFFIVLFPHYTVYADSKPVQVSTAAVKPTYLMDLTMMETQSGWPHSWELMHYGTFWSEGVLIISVFVA